MINSMDDKTTRMADVTMVDDRTPRPEGNPSPDDLGDTLRQQTLRPQGGGMPQNTTGSQTDISYFNLKGESYEEVKRLSENSGEAQVFLVRHEDDEYVLKVYYPNFNINKKLLQVIRSFQFEMIVRLIDYGKTYVDGKSRYYELMEYLKGGTLRELKINGDFNYFRRIALQAAAALAYCHKNNVLHKDVKPANYFFRDETKQELVLGDFGISAYKENDGSIFRTTQARTPIFAAPEMYSDVIDGEVDITPAVDYYSLGMTLFALWLGENPMTSNERTIMKQKNEGRLPRINELPDSVKRLVQGLTAVNPQSRWSYDEVEKWFKGEDVPVDTTSPYLKYKSFVVDPENNLVADNVHELVPLLLDNELLAMNYLYNGQIVAWLDNCGNTRLSAIVKDIVVNKYPIDRKAGLMATCYAMEPTLCYRDVRGVECEDVHAIAMSLLAYKDKYTVLLKNPNDPLFLWLESYTKCDIKRLRSFFDDSSDGRLAVLRTVYEIDPEMPLLAHHPSSTIKEIVHSYGYEQITDDDWQAICDGRFLSWIYSHEDMMAAESLRILTQDKPYSRSLAYKVLYDVDRDSAYDLCEARTPEAVGELLACELMKTQHVPEEGLPEKMAEFISPDGRFYFYAQLHGWIDFLTEANRCFDLKSDENRERLGAYDLRTALYRFCRILGAKPTYLLPDGTILSDASEIEQMNTSVARAEIRDGALAQWLAVFYHEDPTRDFQEEYSYEHTLEEWIMALGRLDQKQEYYRRFMKACEDTKNRVDEVKRLWKDALFREHIWQYVFYAACAIWAVLVLLFGLSDRSIIFSHPFLSVILPLGGMSAIIVSTRSYFKGYGPSLSFFFGMIGMASSLIPYYILKAVETHQPSLFHIVVLVLTALYMTVCHFTDITRRHKTDIGQMEEMLKTDDIKSLLLEPLYYTFKTRSVRYKASNFGVLDEMTDHVNSMSGESVIHYMLWTFTAAVLILELCLLSPSLLGVFGK